MEALTRMLQEEGYAVRIARDGASAVVEIESWRPHLVILDLVLPDINGFAVLREVRANSARTPVLILSAEEDRRKWAKAFRLGADQLAQKPFDPEEVLARVERLLGAGAAKTPELIRFGDVEVDLDAREVRNAGEAVHLTPKQFSLLLALIRHEGRAVSRVALVKEVWATPDAVLPRTVDEHVKELRRLLEPNRKQPRHIITVARFGYRFQR